LGSDFFSVFELYKERYLQQDRQAGADKKALDSFESWLKGNAGLLLVKARGERLPKIDLGKFFTGITLEAKDILAEKGVQINCISLGLKESSKCITVFPNSSIYYRLGKTCPRKGKYSGVDLLIMELVMDGNKNNVFIPMLGRLSPLEKRFGSKIEREGARVEATGKYRFKLLFPFENDDSATTIKMYADNLSDFIYFTREELVKLTFC